MTVSLRNFHPWAGLALAAATLLAACGGDGSASAPPAPVPDPDPPALTAWALQRATDSSLTSWLREGGLFAGWRYPMPSMPAAIEDLVREYNRGMWTIGYTGQSPERLKAHQQNWHTFNTKTLRAEGGPLDHEFYGLPWPCWGTPAMKHPGTANLYDTSLPVADGGLCFRANFGVERNGVNLLAEHSFPLRSEIEDGYPEFDDKLVKKYGGQRMLDLLEEAAIENLMDKHPDKFDLDRFAAINRDIWDLRVATLGEEKASVLSAEDGKRSPVELY